MITHAALTLQEVPDSHPELRRGMPVPRCGFENDGRGVSVAWERRYIDCAMCLLMLDRIPVIPVTEAHFMRAPRRPDYVPEGHVYVSSEFRPERRWPLLATLAAWILSAALAVAVILLCFRYADSAEPSQPPVVVVTPSTYGAPAPGGK